ncbi:hypothetical protein [Erwinia pyri]|uniref:hypothetical protein n=1 Tax=Erwinia pyri TaxID=3062598 RepID=UPI003D1748F5
MQYIFNLAIGCTIFKRIWRQNKLECNICTLFVLALCLKCGCYFEQRSTTKRRVES